MPYLWPIFNPSHAQVMTLNQLETVKQEEQFLESISQLRPNNAGSCCFIIHVTDALGLKNGLQGAGFYGCFCKLVLDD